jgi:hypothetical protein
VNAASKEAYSNDILADCQKLGIFLYFVTFTLPVGVTSRHVDEFGSTLYGFECDVGSFASILNFNSKFLPIMLACLVNPFTLSTYLIGNFKIWSGLRSLQPYLSVFIVVGLIASRIALAHELYRPVYGYWLWIASIVMIVGPELNRWRLAPRLDQNS